MKCAFCTDGEGHLMACVVCGDVTCLGCWQQRVQRRHVVASRAVAIHDPTCADETCTKAYLAAEELRRGA